MKSIYKDFLKPVLFRADAEKIHELGLKTLKTALGTKAARNFARTRFSPPAGLVVNVFGCRFSNPVGIAAGFDKNAAAVDQLASLGFGFVEVGTVTLEPQPGNEKPRLFRIPEDKALINRLGFNNHGAMRAAESLEKSERNCVIGVNIGRNKNVPNEEAEQNYLDCFEIIYQHADYIAINVSSPNTPGLRELQEAKSLDSLLSVLQTKNKELAGVENIKPLLLKIAPDLTFEALDDVINICKSRRIDGIIATNTTVGRLGLKTSASTIESIGAGGLSGKPLMKISNDMIKHIFRKSNGSIRVIGVGGIFTAEDAFEKIANGASLVQGYTGFVYQGPRYAKDINDGLARLLEENGFESIEEACGSKV